jgi:hypothetical protein
MKKLLTLLLILVYSNSIIAQKRTSIEDKQFILDLSKINFKEDINLLFPTQEKFKLILVNDDFEKKEQSEILKGDNPKAFQYSVIMDKKRKLKNVVYDGFFKFDNLKILTNPNNEIIAYQTYDFYEGSMKDIDDFVIKLKNKFKENILKTGKLVNGSLVYQWYSDNLILQLERDIKKEEETTYSNGKETVKHTCYLRLSVYNRKFITVDFEKYLKYKSDFLLYDKDHYVKK